MIAVYAVEMRHSRPNRRKRTPRKIGLLSKRSLTAFHQMLLIGHAKSSALVKTVTLVFYMNKDRQPYSQPTRL
jgi:hypothetical protein